MLQLSSPIGSLLHQQSDLRAGSPGYPALADAPASRYPREYRMPPWRVRCASRVFPAVTIEGTFTVGVEDMRSPPVEGTPEPSIGRALVVSTSSCRWNPHLVPAACRQVPMVRGGYRRQKSRCVTPLGLGTDSRWNRLFVQGDATTLPPLEVDAAFMTANVAQVFLSDRDWAATLRAIRRALRPGGWLVFETRDLARRAWERWTPELTRTVVDVSGVGEVESWRRSPRCPANSSRSVR